MSRKRLTLALSITLISVFCWFALSTSARLETPAPAREPTASQAAVPPEVSYRQLFHALALLNQEALKEERKGRNGVDLRGLFRRLASLDEVQAEAVIHASQEYEAAVHAIEREARPLIESYRQQEEKGSAAAMETVEQLRALQTKLDTLTLRSRDELHTRLGDEAFTKAEAFVQQNIAAQIHVKEIDLSQETPSVTPRDLKRQWSEGVRQGAKRQAWTQATNGIFFCDSNVIRWLGINALWLDPAGLAVFQFSFTFLDFCSGLHYDPDVEGLLRRGDEFVAYDERRGFASFIPAAIALATAAFPNTYYVAYCDHWAIRRPCLVSPETPSACKIYLAPNDVAGITPSCLSGPVTEGQAPKIVPPCAPPPSPTPTPSPPNVKVEAVGFTGDIPLTKWDKNVAKRVKIDQDPNGNRQPTWTRQRNPKFAAAYVRGTNPTMFASFSVTSSAGGVQTTYTVDIQVKRGSNIVAMADNVVIGGGMVPPVSDIQVTGLETQPVVKRGEYEFTWEVSFDNGQTWRPAGKSGKHTIYWTYDTPLARPFKTQGGQECFPVAGGSLECNTIYDRALQVVTEKLGNGSSDLGTIVAKANKYVDGKTTYDPGPDGAEPSEDHPLVMLDRHAQCSANANTLNGALKSVGIPSTAYYFWGGEQVSGRAFFFRAWRPNNANDPLIMLTTRE